MYDEYFKNAHDLIAAGKPFATAVVVRAEKPTSAKPGDRALVTLDGVMHGWIGGSCAQPTVVEVALEAMRDGRSRLVRLSPEPGLSDLPEGIEEVPMTCFSGGTLDVFIEPHRPRPQLLIVGSLPVAQSLAHLGRAMNYQVTAVDPTGGEAMNHADRVVEDLSELPSLVTPLTFLVVATHGEYDESALAAALETDVPYVGLVAGRTRGRAVLEALRENGLGEDALARIKFPAGLDIGARRGDEIALSIMAEIIQTLRGLEGVQWHSDDVSAVGPGSATDPVCGMTVRMEGARHTHEHDGQTYYFCCEGCRARFATEPEAILATA